MEKVKVKMKKKKKPIKVYFAGKIDKNDWRHDILPGLRDSGYPLGELKSPKELDREEFIYTGPFFMSCDHGCCHGENSHGILGELYTFPINEYGDEENENEEEYENDEEEYEDRFGRGCASSFLSEDIVETTEKKVHDLCLQQLNNSDCVFAYINSTDCFGTIYELGVANTLSKKIFICFSNPKIFQQMWFIKRGDKTHSMVFEDPKKALDFALKYFNEKKERQ